MESAESFTLPADAKCAGCGYALFGNESRRCPECGREFDPLDQTTYERGNSNAALLMVGQMLFWRNATIAFWCTTVVAGFSRWYPGEIAFASITLLVGFVTLYFQTRAVNLALGRTEALRYLLIAMFLLFTWLLGPILIPYLVAVEVRNRVKKAV